MYEVCSVLDTNRSIVVSENQNRLKLCIHIIYSIRLFINIPLTDLSLFRVIRPQHRANQSLSILDTNRRTVIKYALQNGVHGNLNCFSIHICSIYFNKNCYTRLSFSFTLKPISGGYRSITIAGIHFVIKEKKKKNITAKEFRQNGRKKKNIYIYV